MKFTVDNDILAGSLSLPIDGLSSEAQAIIQSYTDGYQCNRDFITASMFTAVSTTVGKRICSDDGRYKNYFPFYICLVAPSGSNKTTPMREVLRPLTNRNAANYEVFREAMKKYDAEVKAGNENADKPVYRQLIISDSTPESRIKALSENPNVLLVSDEIATMLYNMNRYNKSGEVPQLISIWSVDDIIINRKSETALLIKEPCLSIIGGTQPDVLADTFGSDYFMSSGFNQRWLFVYPDDIPPAMYSESKVSKEVSDVWSEYINGLLDFDFASNGLGTLYITDKAKQLYIDYYNKLQVKKSGACGYMASVYAKLQIMVERWAGIAHLLGNEPGMSRILPEEMEYSIRCMNYFERCAEKVYMKLTEGRKQPEAKAMGNEEMTARLFFANNPPSIQAFADGVGVSRQFVSKCLKKYDRLRSCGCGDIQTTYNVIDTEKTSATTQDMILE
ncbi:DUF3987 domain-containing protein [Phocaeicola faecium]|uniref:DUF3987 domain-containing protein n=1 Tax=Phocaeicola faecium TaxID=2762213 RepID=A0ABR8V8Q3_9BACT|nr:DUF3987 domain-containing protein [Phocaeicola faecium]MBD8001061.1 DUF3987 domain-containing protein [Phocaeicola faecium]